MTLNLFFANPAKIGQNWKSSKKFCTYLFDQLYCHIFLSSNLLYILAKNVKKCFHFGVGKFFEMGWKSHKMPVLCRTLIFEWIAVKNDIKANNFAMWQTFMWRRVEDEKGLWNRRCGLGGQWGSLQPKPGFRNCERNQYHGLFNQ